MSEQGSETPIIPFIEGKPIKPEEVRAGQIQWIQKEREEAKIRAENKKNIDKPILETNKNI